MRIPQARRWDDLESFPTDLPAIPILLPRPDPSRGGDCDSGRMPAIPWLLASRTRPRAPVSNWLRASDHNGDLRRGNRPASHRMPHPHHPEISSPRETQSIPRRPFCSIIDSSGDHLLSCAVCDQSSWLATVPIPPGVVGDPSRYRCLECGGHQLVCAG